MLNDFKFNISNDEIKKGYEIIFQPFLESYRDRVNELYLDEYNDQGDTFIYMEPIKLCLLLSEHNSYVVIARSERDEFITLPPSQENYEFSQNPEKLKIKFIKEQLQIDSFLDYTQYFAFLKYIGGDFFKESYHQNLFEEAKSNGISTADSHASQYEYYKSLNALLAPKVALDVIDLEIILSKVNNPSFRYEFEESIKAYNAGLYLAAAATGGIALENILRLLIQAKTKANLPQNTYIKDSLAVLKREKVLSNRLSASVDSLKAIRNSNAHTNSDPVKKATIDHLYSVIEDLSYLL
ncbi:hypothetical protein [Lysinibacillus sp. Bpr_S20]|uniref:hypothetical protein n=1 Tax=Lysinibacillus sp. Bpr_S20 TaxID=2933964 RepID=UPI002010FE9A|nr:hypothetical protein [Lysinibacillus sp. Bpr_S20]MCL1701584.1 hypothetical protein [Lysinibacillus sp. Bpr_S20]